VTDASGAPPRSTGSARERAILGVVQLALLLPFLDKAVHIDDAFFLAIARHIRDAPFDPFGFDYNWAGTPAPVWQEMKNPPAVFYWQALLVQLGGEGGRYLHAAFWAFALCASQACYELARRVTREPLYPALLLVVCPAYWVSATSLMIDLPLVAAMTLAVLWLAIAQERDALGWRIGSGVAAAFAVLAKYFGLALLPLLAAQIALRGRPRARDAAVLGPPLIAFAGWWLASDGHFTQAVGYRAEERADLGLWLATHGLSGAIPGCLARRDSARAGRTRAGSGPDRAGVRDRGGPAPGLAVPGRRLGRVAQSRARLRAGRELRRVRRPGPRRAARRSVATHCMAVGRGCAALCAAAELDVECAHGAAARAARGAGVRLAERRAARASSCGVRDGRAARGRGRGSRR
jgi:hypothetical protein